MESHEASMNGILLVSYIGIMVGGYYWCFLFAHFMARLIKELQELNRILREKKY